MRSTFPVQGTLMILIVSGYLRRIEPARSAAVYPQKLQQNVTITGRNSSIKKLLPIIGVQCSVTCNPYAHRAWRMARGKSFLLSVLRLSAIRNLKSAIRSPLQAMRLPWTGSGHLRTSSVLWPWPGIRQRKFRNRGITPHQSRLPPPRLSGGPRRGRPGRRQDRQRIFPDRP